MRHGSGSISSTQRQSAIDAETAEQAQSNRTDGRSSLREELEQRIDDLETMDEQQFGRFTRLDWTLCVAGSLVIPYLCYLWFWP